jgi:hypothetical protein
LFVFLHAYDHGPAARRPVIAFVTLFRDGRKAFETEALSFAATWPPNARAVPIRITLPATPLSPGSYECQVTVLDPASGRAAFWRDAIEMTR